MMINDYKYLEYLEKELKKAQDKLDEMENDYEITGMTQRGMTRAGYKVQAYSVARDHEAGLAKREKDADQMAQDKLDRVIHNLRSIVKGRVYYFTGDEKAVDDIDNLFDRAMTTFDNEEDD